MFPILITAVFFGIVFGIILVSIDDMAGIKTLQKIRCKRGKHAFTSGKFSKKNRYYCQVCKAPRNFPELKVLQGGKKELNTFRF